MIKILFVCHGNICRSPMAEFVMKKMVEERHLSSYYDIESCATSREELGNPVYPPVKRILASVGISCEGKRARQIREDDFDSFDYLLAMENYNIRNLERQFGRSLSSRVQRLMDFTSNPRDVDDPWYSGDFQTALRDIEEGCEALLKETEKRRQNGEN